MAVALILSRHYYMPRELSIYINCFSSLPIAAEWSGDHIYHKSTWLHTWCLIMHAAIERHDGAVFNLGQVWLLNCDRALWLIIYNYLPGAEILIWLLVYRMRNNEFCLCGLTCITAKKEWLDWVTSVAYGICPSTVTACMHVDTFRTNRKYGHCPSMYIMWNTLIWHCIVVSS